MLPAWRASLSPTQVAALEDYGGFAYRTVNSELRSGAVSDATRERMKVIDASLRGEMPERKQSIKRVFGIQMIVRPMPMKTALGAP